LEHPEQLDQFGMDSVHPDFDNRSLSGLANRFLDLLLGLAHDFLDTSGMNPAVRNKLFKGDSGDLAANRIVAGDNHRFGSVVDNNIDPGGSLDRADVAALAPDYAPFHLVVGQREHRDGALGD